MAKKQDGEFQESKFLKDIKKRLGEETSVGIDDRLVVKDWYSTGSKMLDMQLNGGRIDLGGVASGKLTIFAGPHTCGKTYFAIHAAIEFLRKNPEGVVFYFDSESNISYETFLEDGLEEEHIGRVIISRVITLEKFRTMMVQSFEVIRDNKMKAFLILDSVGGLITEKAYEEAHADPNKEGIADVKSTMGRPQQTIKEICKIAIHDGGKLDVPMVFISHVYKDSNAANPKYAGNVVSGGQGLTYFNSNLVEFSRIKSKDNKIENKTIHDVNGILVRSKLKKSRSAREETEVYSLIHFNYGVTPYYGFVSMMEQAGIIVKEGLKYRDRDGKWEKKKSIRELNLDPSPMFPLMEEFQKWTVAQFGKGKMSVSTDIASFAGAGNLDISKSESEAEQIEIETDTEE